MSVLKRLSATFLSRVDHVVSQIEDHDAVVETAIRDARQAAARAKVRMARVQRDGARLRRRLAELRHAESRWVERARSAAGGDEDAALECLKRRRECSTQIAELDSALARHGELEGRLARDIRAAEERVATMAQQRNLMRTRQSAAEALSCVSGMDEKLAGDIDAAFERWEIQVTESELAAGTLDPVDPLERGFIEAEERDDLRAELDDLLRSGTKEHDDER